MNASNATNLLFSTCSSHRRMAQIMDTDEWEPCLDSPTLPLRIKNNANENTKNSIMLTRSHQNALIYEKKTDSLILNSEKRLLSKFLINLIFILQNFR